MPRLALATAIAAAGLDDDLSPLLDACTRAGIDTQVRAWDDPSVAWGRFDAVLLRSTWDYTDRLREFLDWCALVSTQTRLLNPLPVVLWNTDKHYLADLAAHGVDVVATSFVEPDMEPLPSLQAFLAAHEQVTEFVVKPRWARDRAMRSAIRASRNSPPPTTSRACWMPTAARCCSRIWHRSTTMAKPP
jgi:O-ureido-D-serine cyclo-ligase